MFYYILENEEKLYIENILWIKCMIGFNCHTRKALLQVLHDPQLGGIPDDPIKLYAFFSKNEDKIKRLERTRVLDADQISLLLPNNPQTFSSKWNFPLICVVITNFSRLPPPIDGWFRPLDPNDDSVSANVEVARQLSYMLYHGGYDFNDEIIFKSFLSKTLQVLNGLQYSHIQEFCKLETEDDRTVLASDFDERK